MTIIDIAGRDLIDKPLLQIRARGHQRVVQVKRTEARVSPSLHRRRAVRILRFGKDQPRRAEGIRVGRPTE